MVDPDKTDMLLEALRSTFLTLLKRTVSDETHLLERIVQCNITYVYAAAAQQSLSVEALQCILQFSECFCVEQDTTIIYMAG